MAIQLNHTIVWCTDKRRSAAFVTDLFALPPATPFSIFEVVELANGVSLDFAEGDLDIKMQHYAFLVDDDEFTAIHDRIVDQDLGYWADPGRTQPGEINRHDGGRGLYFTDPDGHLMEIITTPYGSGD